MTPGWLLLCGVYAAELAGLVLMIRSWRRSRIRPRPKIRDDFDLWEAGR